MSERKNMGALISLAERVEAYDPRLSPDNRADELALHQDIVMATGLGSLDCEFDRTFVRSLDAAMTLLCDNHAFDLDNGPCHWICLGAQKPMGRCDVKYPKPDYDGEGDSWLTVSAIAATPALALTAAALRARASQEQKQ